MVVTTLMANKIRSQSVIDTKQLEQITQKLEKRSIQIKAEL